MADARKTWTQLDTLFANNTAGAISPQDLRDGFASLEPHVSASAPTTSDDGTDGYDTGHHWLVVVDDAPTGLYVCLDNTTSAAVWKKVWPPDVSSVDAADLGSGEATLGQVLTADGSGASSFSSLGSAAAADTDDFATAAQGGLADSAVQPGDDLTTLGSGEATLGQVPKADGSGGLTFGDESGGGSTPTVSFVVACSDETTDLTTGTGKVTFRMPYAFTVSEVRASVSTAPTGSALTVDINEAGSSILSTKLTIDAGEKTSKTAATAAVISDTALADDAEMSIDIDAIGSSVAGKGLKVAIIGKPT